MCFEKSLWILRMWGCTILEEVFAPSPEALIHRVVCHLKSVDVWQRHPGQPLRHSLISCTVQRLHHGQVSPPGKDPCWGTRTSRLYQDLQSEPAVCNVRKRDDKIAKEDAHYSEISSQWIKSRMLDWVVSRLYYEQASAVVTQYGKKEKGRLKAIIFSKCFHQHG